MAGSKKGDNGASNSSRPSKGSVNGNVQGKASAKGNQRSNRGRSIGPVPDLERHLPSDWWRTLFNALYLKTDGDVVENSENTRLEVDMVVEIGQLGTDDSILDLCCGQGRHVMELSRRGFKNVVGIDRSRYLVRQARQRARRDGLNVSFHEGDARRFRQFDAPFDCVTIMGNSFGYFEHARDDEAVLKNVGAFLREGGTVILDVVDGIWMASNFEKRSWEWIDQNHFVCRERDLARDGERIVTREVITHAEKGVIADQFYAERLYTPEGLSKLLQRAGFTDVHVHKSIEALSSRGQDLGMMAHRIVVSAKSITKPRVVGTKRCKPSKITVITGDPRLPDTVKPDDSFGSADMETLDRMKKALEQIPNFTFTYLDNHPGLMKALAVNPPDFVLNLCDEGYMNDPFMELHVPSYLEMLKIPYTGAAPTCLGLCYNKSLVNQIAHSMDIPVPMETYVGSGDSAATLPSTFPAILKPNFGDSSVGITRNSIVNTGEELVERVEWLRQNVGKGPILIQEFLTGREFSVGIIGNPGLTMTVLPPLEVDYSGLDQDLPKILGYESKWIAGSPWWDKIKYCQAEVEDEIIRSLTDYSNLLFERLGCRDYARFDFRCDSEGRLKLLEVNPNPGWCWDGKMNMMAEFMGLNYTEFLELIISAARERLGHARSGLVCNI
ncbi:MAG: D-alanine--D-alanine ligase [Candidatus Wallbacteria bacterium HGW-Wallbacteria-1]|jgi:D-alanine-D-alanine ligase|uniref:D-alanine--D-alanine ligase n=1 Tax=Candidatus Wallbacteria bacterium HGW-Wallbacteria-1 TaxID=2013854 RepID=A0A2N1PJI0_9BACT|nr:MAG: D-alanine--D-alanine ligase [Candidatus Wallbacteria bacterium HGW-Wallbacteria-1]